MPVNIRFTAALAVAVTGLTVGLITGSRNNIGAIESTVTPQQPLAKRLEDIHRALAIRPDQDIAWQRYTDALSRLNRSSRDLLQRVANGGAQDDGTERLLHALALGAAFAELEKNLSPGQIAQARFLTRDLAGDFICRGLAENLAR
jgi:hypothetical protein